MNLRWKQWVLLGFAIAGAGLTFGVAAFFAFKFAAHSRTERQQTVPAASLADPALAGVPTANVGSQRRPSMRDRVYDAIVHTPVRSASELKAYLDQLEAQARKRGQVTALDIEPGLAMIQAYGTPEQLGEFSERMQAVQEEPSSQQSSRRPLARGERTKQLDQLLGDIAQGSGRQKQDLIRDYLETAQGLPAEEMLERMARLNEIAGENPGPVDQPTLDSLRQGIDDASDEGSRQELIRDYLELLHTLPNGGALQAADDFNRRYGSLSAAAATERAQ